MRDLQADLELCSKATKGSWAVNSHPAGWIDIINPLEDTNKRIATVVEMGDAEFVAAARTGWPEAIERALAAEETMAMWKGICENSPTQELDEQHYKEKIAALREENDLQRHSIQQLSAQVAELRDALESIKKHECPPIYTRDGHCLNAIKGCFECMAGYHLERISSNPGADLLAKIAKLEAVAEAAREFMDEEGCPTGHVSSCRFTIEECKAKVCPQEKLAKALATYEGPADE